MTDIAAPHGPHGQGPGRPSLSCASVRARAAKALAGRIVEALAALGAAVTVEEAASRLLRATSAHRDGPAIAEAMARQSEQPASPALVEVLDDFRLEMLRAHDALVAEWVARCAIRPLLGVGAAVRVTTNDRSWRRVTVEGEIVGVDLIHARYRVHSPALGHGDGGIAPAARAIPFEDVQPAGNAAGAADAAPQTLPTAA